MVSDSREAFENALEQYGYTIAKGDRRGFVAIDWRGKVFSLSKWLNVKTKVLKERLGDSEQFPGIAETTARIDKQLVERLKNFTADKPYSHETVAETKNKNENAAPNRAAKSGNNTKTTLATERRRQTTAGRPDPVPTGRA